MTSDSTDDAALARALAKTEQEEADAELATRLNLNEAAFSHSKKNNWWGYPGKRIRSDFQGINSAETNGTHHPSTFADQSEVNNNAGITDTVFDQSHMCYVPCMIGDSVCMEMIIDSGAMASIISLPLVKRIGLEHDIDRSQFGIASGVGRAKILGKIWNVICTLGQVQFKIDFMVLDASDQILLLGLDQLRKFKCMIDLERNVLVFGGSGGLEVPMLPPNNHTVDVRSALGMPSCVTM